MENETIKVALELYKNLNWWKRMRIFYWYKHNNWDVTGAWKECIDIADKMVKDAKLWVK
jgi:hypothetical protein